jgi:signal transduction histidine kinase
VFHGVIWPHLAFYRARVSAHPHRAERQQLLVDSALGGMFIALMEFSLLPSVLLITMLSMDKLGWGVNFLLRASSVLAGSCALAALLTGVPVRPETSMLEIAGSVPLMVAYPIAIASALTRSGRLARERRRVIEQTVALREELGHIARVGTLGEMAAGLAHELNQPLTAINLEAHTALELAALNDLTGIRDTLGRISDQSIRAGDIVRRMRTFSRRAHSTRENADLADLIREVLALLDHDLRLAGVETRLELQDVPRVQADHVEIQQVLVNLIRNAVEAMSESTVLLKRLTIRTEVIDGNVRVSVIDTGPGIDPAILDRLFHPFQSTKHDGLGLGLSICETLIEAHGGRIKAVPQSPGAIIYFELPV